MPVLFVSSAPESHMFFTRLARKTGWRLFNAYDFRGFLILLGTQQFAAVVCEDNLPDANWLEILEILLSKECSTGLIVTARHADERLWTEVLHRGGYDVLAQPLDPTEVERVVGCCRAFNERTRAPRQALKKSA